MKNLVVLLAIILSLHSCKTDRNIKSDDQNNVDTLEVRSTLVHEHPHTNQRMIDDMENYDSIALHIQSVEKIPIATIGSEENNNLTQVYFHPVNSSYWSNATLLKAQVSLEPENYFGITDFQYCEDSKSLRLSYELNGAIKSDDYELNMLVISDSNYPILQHNSTNTTPTGTGYTPCELDHEHDKIVDDHEPSSSGNIFVGKPKR